MDLLPPSQTHEYPSRKALIEALQAHAKSQGYAITIQRSCNRDGTVTLGCDRSGQYDARGLNDTNRIRDTGSRLIGCPFSVCGKLKNTVLTVKVCNPDHNHETSSTPMAHSIYRRLPAVMREHIKDLSTSGITAKEIMTDIRLMSNHPVLANKILLLLGVEKVLCRQNYQSLHNILLQLEPTIFETVKRSIRNDLKG
jgi:hypothetical protein